MDLSFFEREWGFIGYHLREESNNTTSAVKFSLSDNQVHFRKFSDYHPKPSSPCVLSLGIRLLNRAALPLARAMESCWKRWRMVVVSSSPVWRARALPSFLTSLMAYLCQAPRDSTARGKKTMPCALQGCQDLSSFLLWATVSA